jgi:hypothetical protein
MQSEQHGTEGASANGVALARRLLMVAAVTLLLGAGLVGGYYLLRGLPNACSGLEQYDESLPPSDKFRFVGWGKPDLVLVVSGQLHGYIKPCGCSPIQYGGLARRLVFINELKAKGWQVVGVDLGEVAATTGIREQQLLKLQLSMRALDIMGYKAIGIGKHEMVMPLTEALIRYSADNPNPRPLASSLDKLERKGEPYFDLNVRRYETFGGAPAGVPRVGVLSLTGPDLAEMFRQDKSLHFLNNSVDVMPKVQQAFAREKVDIAMLLHHDYAKDPATGEVAGMMKMDGFRRTMAEKCATSWEDARQAAAKKKQPAIPPLQLLMVLTEEPEPPSMLHQVSKTPTYILEIGHKGKYVGVVGIFRRNGQIELKYELVRMEPSLEPKDGQKNAILDLLEEYAAKVKADNLLAKVFRAPHPIQMDPYVQEKYGGSHFVGSNACSECHNHTREYATWLQTKHSHAYETLVKKAKQPSLRQFDPECVVCHTVGFSHPEGFNELPRGDLQAHLAKKADAATIRKEIADRNIELAHVGCESCHGPGSAHIRNRKDERLHALMNPFRPSEKEKQLVKQMQANPNPAVKQQAGQEAKLLFTRRMQRIEDFCTTKCHDLENDVNWSKVPFLEKWAGGTAPIIHNRPDNVGNVWLPARNPVPATAPRKAD